MVVTDRESTGPVIYIDRSEVHEHRWGELETREIEVFGHLSERAVELVRQKAATLGDGGVVTLHEQFAGFARLAGEET